MRRNHIFIEAMLIIALIGIALSFPDISKGQERTMDLRYSISIEDIPKNADNLYIWIPIPRSNSIQNLVDMQIPDDISYSMLVDEKFKNRFLYIALSEEQMKNSEFSFGLSFQVDRKGYKLRDLSEIDGPLEQFLQPNKLVPIDGKVAEEALSVVGNTKEPRKQARLLFNHIVDTINYDKSGTGWGLGDANYACDIRAGNCTDFHSLFIGEARSLKIPARFIIGFPIPSAAKSGEIKGYHCWGEFYIEGEGWIPIDASEAKKNLDKREEYFRNLDPNRVSFTFGRDIKLPRAQSNPVRNYIIYPYAEVDGKELPIKWKMTFKEL